MTKSRWAVRGRVFFVLFILWGMLVAGNGMNAVGRPDMKLGKFLELGLSVADLAEAKTFYERLGFLPAKTIGTEHPSAAYTDGNIVLTLHQREFPSPGLFYFAADLAPWRAKLTAAGIAFEEGTSADGRYAELSFRDPEGFCVFLTTRKSLKREDVAFEPLDPARVPDERRHFSALGMFGELALATRDRLARAEFWKGLGFEARHESESPYPWGIYSDGMAVLGFHQTPEFEGAKLTFFSKDSARRIEDLKARGILFTQEMEGGNALLTAPDGTAFFLFNLP